MIDRTHSHSVVRQYRSLGVARSTAYYQPTPISASAVALMRRMDLTAISHKPSLNHRHPAHRRTYPDLLPPTRSSQRSSKPCGRRISPTFRWNRASCTRLPSSRDDDAGWPPRDLQSTVHVAWRHSTTLITDFCLDSMRRVPDPLRHLD